MCPERSVSSPTPSSASSKEGSSLEVQALKRAERGLSAEVCWKEGTSLAQKPK